MKGLKQLLLFSGLALVGLYACTKELSSSSGGTDNPTTVTHTLTLSASSVKMGQPLVASIPSGLTANSVRWSVTPSAGAQVTTNGLSATIVFSASGAYTISGTYYTDSASGTQDSCIAPVTVTDSTYTAPSSVDSTTLIGEKFILVPAVVGDSVYIHIETADTYQCDLTLNVNPGGYPTSDSVWVNYLSVAEGVCDTLVNPKTQAVGIFAPNPLSVGSSQTISIFLPGGETTYLFTETATSTGYTFTPISGGNGLITINPTTINN